MTQPYDPHHDPRYQGPPPPPQPPPQGHGPPQSAPPPGYGQQPGYGPPHPQQPGHGGPFPGGYGARPPGGYGPGQPAGGYGPPAPPQKKSSTGLVIGIIAGALVLVLLLAAGGVWLYTSSRGDSGSGGSDALAGAEVLTFEGLDASHVDTGERVEYDMFPPAGGPHYSAWQDCNVYDEPVRAEFAVHSLEHGAVWITYDPSLSSDQIAVLEGLYTPGGYLVISPMEGLPTPVVASAWGAQIQLGDAEDPALGAFLREYVQSPDAPEPGALCSQGVTETEAEVEAMLEEEGPTTA
ncbi:DUF3105 domain-containing protein [Nocardiopsis sp. CC223A]|uniref:DUF3105 domain-containing protein n=1 Tax=Nocardiopsis sp. CC223A TaxID=3044051 RepID=UPI00278C7622|nr:DUF3105 domain-containing protein [Nocardiopsis sp. CC223A]